MEQRVREKFKLRPRIYYRIWAYCATTPTTTTIDSTTWNVNPPGFFFLFIFYALLIFYFSYENHLDRDDVMSLHSSPGLIYIATNGIYSAATIGFDQASVAVIGGLIVLTVTSLIFILLVVVVFVPRNHEEPEDNRYFNPGDVLYLISAASASASGIRMTIFPPFDEIKDGSCKYAKIKLGPVKGVNGRIFEYFRPFSTFFQLLSTFPNLFWPLLHTLTHYQPFSNLTAHFRVQPLIFAYFAYFHSLF